METNLASFRNDLATVSADIESLQARSAALNRRLDNRKGVEKELGPLVEELSVSPETISKISEGHIDESWSKVLSDVDRRTTMYRKKTAGAPQSRASEDLGPLLEKLTLKVPHSLQRGQYTNADFNRPSSAFATFLLRRSKPYDPLILTPKFYSSTIFSGSRTSSHSCISTTRHLRARSHWHT